MSHGWEKEKIWVPNKNWWPSTPQSDALTTELRRTHGELGHIQGSHVICVLSTARISNVEIIVCMMYVHVCKTGVRKVIIQFLSRTQIFSLSHACDIYHFSFSIMPLEKLLRNLDNESENWGFRLELDCYRKLHCTWVVGSVPNGLLVIMTLSLGMYASKRTARAQS